MAGMNPQVSSKKLAKVFENFCGTAAETERDNAHP
jgi:hypothetical protein